MTILSAYDLKQGKTTDVKTSRSFVQPVQALPNKEKTDDWKRQNLDWYEQLGIRQLNSQSRRLAKLYRLADGMIDKHDYILEQENDSNDIIASLTKDMETPFDLKFYPIIPNVVNILTGEHSKRTNKTLIDAVDEFSTNEMLEDKRKALEEFLVAKAQQDIAERLANQGIPVESEEAQQAFSQIESLPQLQSFFAKSYQSIPQIWASKQLEVDENRFKMYELENLAFRDSIITGREFWHVHLKEDDYEVEVWNPINTFYHHTAAVRYVSEGDYVGRILMMSMTDIINRYGYLMTADQIKSLEQIYSNYNNGLIADGHDFTAAYDTSKKPHEQEPNSYFFERLTAARSMYHDAHMPPGGYDYTYNYINSPIDFYAQGMVRVTECYWQSQRKLGHLTKIDEDGNLIQEVITEDYKITDKPVYDLTLVKDKTKENLVFGEHIDWIWVNEVWKGVKISPNYQTHWTERVDSFTPLYLDVRPLKFQFKGVSSLYGSRLPVEGFVNTTSVVQQMRPHQIGYNMVNNQIADILVDELGTIIVLDQNALPRQSMGEEWGQHNFAKSWQVMKDFSILPLDTSITNTEVATNFQHFQSINLSQDARLKSRIELGMYFKEQAFETIGITRQRAGNIQAQETATGVQQAVNNSYAQTEPYFTQHTNFLMPRVKEMMLNAAQYYNSTKPSVQLAYTNSQEEKVFFQIEGNKLLLRDYNVIPTGKPNQKAVLDQLKQLAVENNTTNATIYDLMKMVASDSTSEVINTAKEAVRRAQEEQQRQMQAEQEMLQQQIQAEAEDKERQRQFEAEQNQLDREARIVEQQIESLGFAADKDMNQNRVPDVMEVAQFNASTNLQNQQNLIKQQELQAKNDIANRTIDAKEKEIEAKERISQRQLEISRENRNRHDLKPKPKIKK